MLSVPALAAGVGYRDLTLLTNGMRFRPFGHPNVRHIA